MEQTKSIILQVDESTKKVMSELERQLSDGFAGILESLRAKINSSSDAIESLKNKMNRINEVQDSINETSSKSDEIKNKLDSVLKVMSAHIGVDVDSSKSDNPLDRNVTKGDLESSNRESLISIDKVRECLSESIKGVDEHNAALSSSLNSLLQDVYTSISHVQEENIELAKNLELGFKDVLKILENSVGKGLELISELENKINESNKQTTLSITQQFEHSIQESNTQFENNQKAYNVQLTQLNKNSDVLNEVLRTVLQSFGELETKLKELSENILCLHKSHREQLDAYFNSIKDAISNDFSLLRTTIGDHNKELINEIETNIKIKTNELITDINSEQKQIVSRLDSIEKDYSEISKRMSSFQTLFDSEVSAIKANQVDIQKTIYEVLYLSIPFWKVKSRKTIKNIIQK